MNHLKYLPLLFLSACASQSAIINSPAPVPVDPPPVAKVSAFEQAALERLEFIASVKQINKTMDDERLSLAMCEEVHGDKSKDCEQLLMRLCKDTVLLDSRGWQHVKDYCFFNSEDNPY